MRMQADSTRRASRDAESLREVLGMGIGMVLWWARIVTVLFCVMRTAAQSLADRVCRTDY